MSYYIQIGELTRHKDNYPKLWHIVKGALDAEKTAFGYVGIAFGCLDAGMAKKSLNVADIGSIFK